MKRKGSKEGAGRESNEVRGKGSRKETGTRDAREDRTYKRIEIRDSGVGALGQEGSYKGLEIGDRRREGVREEEPQKREVRS